MQLHSTVYCTSDIQYKKLFLHAEKNTSGNRFSCDLTDCTIKIFQQLLYQHKSTSSQLHFLLNIYIVIYCRSLIIVMCNIVNHRNSCEFPQRLTFFPRSQSLSFACCLYLGDGNSCDWPLLTPVIMYSACLSHCALSCTVTPMLVIVKMCKNIAEHAHSAFTQIIQFDS